MYGCDSIIYTTLKVKELINDCIVFTNAFTPNGDGINDYWVLYRNPCFRKIETSVYNRYGSLVYNSKDYQNNWDGQYRNKPLPDGTYYFVIKADLFNNKVQIFKGNITILR
jgi:gliding motility-associated-like protein